MKGTGKDRPLYFLVAQSIRDKISTGEYKEGDLLPTEKALGEEYAVSRVTVRKAIEHLIEEGIVVRNFGRSAAVKSAGIPRSTNQLNGLFEELESKGIKCSSYLLSQKILAADEALAKKLECTLGEEVLRIERLRYADGVPLCYQCIYLLHAYCGNLDISELSHTSLYRMLKERCAVTLSYAAQSISAELSSYRIAALLELEGQRPMLKVVRNAYMENERCLEYSENFYVSARYNLTMTLRS